MTEMISMVVIVIVLGLLVKTVNSDKPWLNKIKGDVGEKIVAQELENLNESYRVKNSVDENILVNHYQIDHVVVNDSKRMIYVIETKNWHGNIKGSKDDKKWSVKMGGEIYEYNNPIIQNELHCGAVRNKFKGYGVVNLVVFANDDVRWYCKCRNVIRVGELVEYIENDVGNRRKTG